MMTPERIAEIRKRVEAATEGPWEWERRWEPDRHLHDYDGSLGCLTTTIGNAILWYGMDGEEGIYCPLEADAALFQGARQDIPRLLDDLETTRADLRSALEHLACSDSTLFTRGPLAGWRCPNDILPGWAMDELARYGWWEKSPERHGGRWCYRPIKTEDQT